MQRVAGIACLQNPYLSPGYLSEFHPILPLGLTQKPQSKLLAVSSDRWPASHSLAASQKHITSLPRRSPHPSKPAPSSMGSPGQSHQCSAGLQRDQIVRNRTPGLSVAFPSTQAPVFHTKPQRRGSHRAGQWITDIDPIANPFAFTSVSTWVWERGGSVQLWPTVTLGRHPVSFPGL